MWEKKKFIQNNYVRSFIIPHAWLETLKKKNQTLNIKKQNKTKQDVKNHCSSFTPTSATVSYSSERSLFSLLSLILYLSPSSSLSNFVSVSFPFLPPLKMPLFSHISLALLLQIAAEEIKGQWSPDFLRFSHVIFSFSRFSHISFHLITTLLLLWKCHYSLSSHSQLQKSKVQMPIWLKTKTKNKIKNKKPASCFFVSVFLIKIC